MKSCWITYVRAGACALCAASWEEAWTQLATRRLPRFSRIAVVEQAEVLVITGPQNAAAAEALRPLLERWRVAGGRLLVLAGACAIDGSLWPLMAPGSAGGVEHDWLLREGVEVISVGGDPCLPRDLATAIAEAVLALPQRPVAPPGDKS